MLSQNSSTEKSEMEFYRSSRQGINKTIYVAIAIVIILAIIAMTGVYYEFW